MPDSEGRETLNEALDSLGVCREPGKHAGKKALYNEDGAYLGDLSAGGAWKIVHEHRGDNDRWIVKGSL